MSQDALGKLSKDILRGIGLTSLIFAFSIYLPVVGFFFSLLIPLPILFYRVKLGRNNGAIIPALTIFSMVLVLGGISADILFFAGLMVMGFTLGGAFERNLSVEKTVGYSSGIVLFSGITGLMLYSSFQGTGLVDMVSSYVAKSLELTLVLYEKMGVPEENVHIISGAMDEIQYVLVRIIPSIITALTLFVAWTTLLFAKPIFRSVALFFPDFGALNLWKAPEHLVWGVIGCGLLLLLQDKALKVVGLNGVVVLMMVYFFQGIAIVSFYFEKKRFPPALKFFMYSIIAFQQIILLFVIGLGFFDIWLDFRKLAVKESN